MSGLPRPQPCLVLSIVPDWLGPLASTCAADPEMSVSSPTPTHPMLTLTTETKITFYRGYFLGFPEEGKEAQQGDEGVLQSYPANLWPGLST